MRSLVTLCLALATSSWAYQVIVPNPTQGWTNDGSQNVSWSMVATDPSNFTIVLTNTNSSVMPIDKQVLAASVEGSISTTTVRPPSGGWVVGRTYRVNLVKSENDLDTIYAQSAEFDITASNSSSSGRTTPAATLPNTRTTLIATGTNTGTPAPGASGTTDEPATPSNAAVSTSTHSGFVVALFALLATTMA